MTSLSEVAALDLRDTGTAVVVPRQMAPVPTAITPMQMLAMAIERGADVGMLAKLMDLQERWEANEARKAFVVAFAEFKKVRPVIEKNKHVGFKSKRTDTSTDYDHATIDNVCDKLDPLLSAHGFTYSWKVDQSNEGIKVTCVLTHVQGHSESVALKAPADGSGNKNSIQAVGSTATYLSRYSLLLATGCVTKSQDDDADAGGAGEMISGDEKQQLIELLRETNADTTKFLAWLEVPNLDKLPLAKFAQAKSALENKRKAMGARA